MTYYKDNKRRTGAHLYIFGDFLGASWRAVQGLLHGFFLSSQLDFSEISGTSPFWSKVVVTFTPLLEKRDISLCPDSRVGGWEENGRWAKF